MNAGRLVVISGASSGIGEAIARELNARGDRVICLARREDKLQKLADELAVSYYAVDLAEAVSAEQVCRRILDEHGTPDVVINNAGAGNFLSIEETSSEEFRHQLDAPLLAAFHLTRGLIEPMIARGSGTIYQINTPAAAIPWPGAVGYATARAALAGFTDALRQGLWETGVRVGSFTPPRVHSDYFEANPGASERIPRAEIVIGSMTPSQVADAIADALDKRAAKDTYKPRRLAAVIALAKIAPGPFRWLFRLTGHKR